MCSCTASYEEWREMYDNPSHDSKDCLYPQVSTTHTLLYYFSIILYYYSTYTTAACWLSSQLLSTFV